MTRRGRGERPASRDAAAGKGLAAEPGGPLGLGVGCGVLLGLFGPHGRTVCAASGRGAATSRPVRLPFATGALPCTALPASRPGGAEWGSVVAEAGRQQFLSGQPRPCQGERILSVVTCRKDSLSRGVALTGLCVHAPGERFPVLLA